MRRQLVVPGRRHRPGVGLGVAAAILVALAVGPAAGPVRAAGVSVDLDQWASLSLIWQNGDLNGNNARYPEGGAVPFRLAIEGLTPGAHVITISYDFTASGHKAYDFLATWNATNSPGLCARSGGAISSMCPGLPAPTSSSFPSDAYVANGLSVHGAELWSGASRRLTIFGGTISSISGPTHQGSPDGNSTGAFVVGFRSTGTAVLLVWAGHLAQSSYWDTAAGGPRDGASMVSGAPWHMRTLNLDGGGARNQDRSIQPSAIVGELPPFALTPSPPPTAAPRTAPTAAVPPGSPSASGGPAGPGPGRLPTLPPTASRGGAGDPSPPGTTAAMLAGLLIVVAAGLRLPRIRRRSSR